LNIDEKTDTIGKPPPATSSERLALTGWTTRAWRLLRLFAHVLSGIARLYFVFPRRSREQQRAMISIWSLQLLHLLGISLRVVPGAAAAPCVIVANHISWLDPFVIHAPHAVRFVAKAEIRGWPLIGTLCEKSETLFIERVKRRDAHRINAMLGAALDAGDMVALFPEGTTTDGDLVRHFHGSLLQAAIDRGLPLQPVSLRYLTAQGARCAAAAHVGEQSLAASLWEVLSQETMVAELHFLPAIPVQGRNRRELAHQAELAIANALGVPVVHTPTALPGGLPGAPR
jgi:1-acyl-sn-glycerol-3-phosphate acyltransferase